MSEQSTDQSEPATAIGVSATETEVGSVFVSNYPPYSFWGEETLGEVERVLDRKPEPNAVLGVYLHIPFCRKRCKFCYFRVYTDKNSEDVERYLDAMLAELAMQHDRPAFAGRKPTFVYLGGGTPSFLAAKHLRRLFTGLRSYMSWEDIEEVAFECEPGTLTRTKLEAIREIGVTRLSLGVENFDDHILESNGRAHTSTEIYRVLPWLEELQFDQVNIDLISGMVGETWETWRDSVDKTIQADPESVTVYQMELPFNTVYSKRVLGGDEVPIADWQTKRDWHAYAFEKLAESGYEISSAYTMVKSGGSGRFVYRDSVWQGCDLLGLGVSSFSHVHGVHYQNLAHWAPYLERVEKGSLPLSRAFVTTEEQRMTREVILQLKQGHIEPAYFEKKFKVAIRDRFAEPLAKLQESKMLEVHAESIRLTPEGLLRADQLLPEFYAPEYQNARYT